MKVIVIFMFVAAVLGADVHNTSSVRIVGGEDTTIEQHPYAVALFWIYWNYFYHHSCTGTLVTRDIVVSAAHCFVFDVQLYTFRLGATDFDYGAVHTLKSYTKHEQNSFRDYDVGIARLSVPVTLSERIGLARLPTARYVVNAGDEVLNIGWGSHTYGGLSYGSLQRAQVFVIDQDDCVYRYKFLQSQPWWGAIQPPTPRMMCTGVLDGNEGGKGACTGDAGGPVIHNGDVLVGITSDIQRCGDDYYPDRNVRVTAVSDWIQKQIILSKFN